MPYNRAARAASQRVCGLPAMTPRREQFLSTYTRLLSAAHNRRPQAYSYPLEAVPRMAEKMVQSLALGTCFLSDTIRKTCRTVGCAPSVGALRDWLKEEAP